MTEWKPTKTTLFYAMNAAAETAEDFPDGAWQAYLEDTVKHWNEQHGTDYDPFDTWQEWMQWRNE